MYQTPLSLKTTSNNQKVVAMLAAACNLLVCASWMYAQRPRLPKQLGRLFEWGLEALLHLPDASVKIIDVYRSQSKQHIYNYIITNKNTAAMVHNKRCRWGGTNRQIQNKFMILMQIYDFEQFCTYYNLPDSKVGSKFVDWINYETYKGRYMEHV